MMLRKYLPRVGAGVLAPLAAAACGDGTGPGDANVPRVTLEAAVAGDAPVGQRGVALTVALRDSQPVARMRVLVDPGTPQAREFPWAYDGYGAPFRAAWAVAYVDAPGRHSFTVVVGDTAGREVRTTFERTFAFPDAAYTVTALPDLGHGGAARALNAAGDAAGWVLDAQGRQRPAVWRAGAGTLATFTAGVADTAGAAAARINAAGDVLVQLGAPGRGGVRVRRADGALFTVGPLKFRDPPQARAFDACCTTAADLSDDRRALGATYNPSFPRSLVFDVAAGAAADSVDWVATHLAGPGQTVGAATTGVVGYPSTYVAARGFTPAALPEGVPATICDRPGRYTSTAPLDADNDANLLVSHCGTPAYLPRAGAGPSVWADRYVGRGTAHLSRTGRVVASRDSTGALWVWRVGTAAVTRVRVAGSEWRVDSLHAVNGSGTIAAYGVNTATGRGAALLLTPAGP